MHDLCRRVGHIKLGKGIRPVGGGKGFCSIQEGPLLAKFAFSTFFFFFFFSPQLKIFSWGLGLGRFEQRESFPQHFFLLTPVAYFTARGAAAANRTTQPSGPLTTRTANRCPIFHAASVPCLASNRKSEFTPPAGFGQMTHGCDARIPWRDWGKNRMVLI